MKIARKIIELHALWQDADKDVIVDNLEALLVSRGCKNLSDCRQKIMAVTGSGVHTVYAWTNKGRKNVKVPFLKLCEIADKYDVELVDLLMAREANEEC